MLANRLLTLRHQRSRSNAPVHGLVLIVRFVLETNNFAKTRASWLIAFVIAICPGLVKTALFAVSEAILASMVPSRTLGVHAHAMVAGLESFVENATPSVSTARAITIVSAIAILVGAISTALLVFWRQVSAVTVVSTRKNARVLATMDGQERSVTSASSTAASTVRSITRRANAHVTHTGVGDCAKSVLETPRNVSMGFSTKHVNALATNTGQGKNAKCASLVHIVAFTAFSNPSCAHARALLTAPEHSARLAI